MSLIELSRPTPIDATEDGEFLRLASCPRCFSRRRALVEVNGRLRGRCLACGEELIVPLAVESHRQVELAGRSWRRRVVDSGD
jgi:hypothetical protein